MCRLHHVRRCRNDVRPLVGSALLGAPLIVLALAAVTGTALAQMDAPPPADAAPSDDQLAQNHEWLNRLLRDMRTRQAEEREAGATAEVDFADDATDMPDPSASSMAGAPGAPVPLLPRSPDTDQEAAAPPRTEPTPQGVSILGGPSVPALTGSGLPPAGEQSAAAPRPDEPVPFPDGPRQPPPGLLDGPDNLGQIRGDYEVHGELALVSGQLEGFNDSCGFGLRPERDELIAWYRHHELARNIGRIRGIFELGVELGREGPCTAEQHQALVTYWETLMGRTRAFVQAYR